MSSNNEFNNTIWDPERDPPKFQPGRYKFLYKDSHQSYTTNVREVNELATLQKILGDIQRCGITQVIHHRVREE